MINNTWFDDNAFKCFKNPLSEAFYIADTDGTINTLEGPVNYPSGYYIMTGPKGEQYPMNPEKFHQLKDDNGDGTATPKKIIKLAKIADHSGTVHTSWGEPLNYNPDVDVIIKHGDNDFGVVKREIFDTTYSIME